MTLHEILDSFDKSATRNFDEYELSSELKTLLPENRDETPFELLAEAMAFEFAEDYENKETGWGTYFGPMFVINNNDGTATESPSIRLVTNEMIDYWERRASQSTNPILIARYAGLVWDFKQRITNTKPSHQVGRTYINSLIATSQNGIYKREVYVFRKIERALKLAIEINDTKLIEQCKDALVAFEKASSIDNKPGLWGYSFDLLVGNKKVKLSEQEENEIIEELEAKLKRLTTKDETNSKIEPWAAEAAANRLAQYYDRKQRLNDVERVITEVEKAYEAIFEEASAMQISGWIEHLYHLFKKFHLKEKAESALLRLRELGTKVTSELKTISATLDIPKDKLDEFIQQMTEGNVKEFLLRLTVNYIPKREKAKELIFHLAKQAPFVYLIGQALQDEKGRVIAKIGSLQDDLEGHIVRQVSQDLTFSSLLMRLSIQEAEKKFSLNKNHVFEYLKDTPLINSERMEVIEKAIGAYFNGDYLIFTHLVIPQMEEAIRNIVELGGGNILKPSKSGGSFHVKTFDEILRDPLIENLGEDFTTYFRILFTDPRGWNLRNNVCHGLASPKLFNHQTADRVLHALLCLKLIQFRK